MIKLSKEGIRTAIREYEDRVAYQEDKNFLRQGTNHYQRAAVVIPLLKSNGDWHILLTKRSDALADHSGQVAYPGGAYESQDSGLRATALREMNEEIGINPKDADVFGHLGDLPIVTGYLVRPYVAQIPWPYPLQISRDEVHSVFTIPLTWLVNPQNCYVKKRIYAGKEIPVVFFNEFEGYQLWGASAEMTLTLFSALKLL